MHKLFLFILLVLIAFPYGARAADPDSVHVRGVAQDATTKTFLVDYVVRSYAIDAEGQEILVRTDTCHDIAARLPDNEWVRNYVLREMTSRQRSIFDFHLLPGRYRIVVDHDRYELAEQIIDIPHSQRGHATTEWELKDFLLIRKAHKLSEAVVNTTRIKMTMKGDTLVYNADAFQLSEGSMLDALIEMMPGLELRDGGKIYHNGEYVPELLLNGKNFFKGDPAVALMNLPAYSVKELRVYHKAPNGAYLRDNSMADSLSWEKALDVRLKKEYNRSWLGNVELAGGAGIDKGQFLSRFFLLGFTQKSRFSIYGNANNLSNQEAASANGSWTQDRGRRDSGEGTKAIQYGGLDLYTESPDAKVKFNTSLTARNEHNNVERYTSSTIFIPSGDVFNRSHSDSHSRNTELKLQEDIKYVGKEFYAEIVPFVMYTNSQRDLLSLSAQFDADPQDTYRGEALDIIEGVLSETGETDGVVNRLTDNSLFKMTTWRANLNYNFFARTPWLRNNVTVNGFTKYDSENSSIWSHYNLANVAVHNFQNKYSTSPSTDFSNYLSFRYRSQDFKYYNYNIDYSYNKIISTGKYNLYRLDWLAMEENDDALGILPSMSDWRTLAIDADNSYNSLRNSDSYTIIPNISVFKKDVVHLDIKPGVKHLRHYHRDTRSELSKGEILTHYTFFEPDVNLRYIWKPHFGLDSLQRSQSHADIVLRYNRNYTAPSSTHLLLIRDTRDPLRLTLGNPNLRASARNQIHLLTRIQTPVRYLQFSASYSYITDAFAQGMTYNATTGGYIYHPENIDGNKTFSADAIIQFMPKRSPLVFHNRLTYNYNHSVDLISGERSVVFNHTVSETPSLTYTKSKYTAKASANVNWAYASGSREDYTLRSTFDLQYGLELNVRDIIWGLSCSTDFNICQRRGYDDASMNDHSLVWNVNISRGFGKGKAFSLILKGHDLLHQLSHISRTINAQGLTETWVNGVPSYVMLHAIYRFNWRPKK